MEHKDFENLASLFSIIGLACALSMAHTIRYGAINKVASSLGLLLLPTVVALVWRLYETLGWWWTLVLFVALSMVASSMGTVYARKNGIPALFKLQPKLGVAAVVLAVLAWGFRTAPAT